MTVGELIKLLANAPQDLPVVVNDREQGYDYELGGFEVDDEIDVHRKTGRRVVRLTDEGE